MTILLFFIETKLGRTIALTIAIALGLFIGWIVFKTHYENIGRAKVLHQIAIQNAEAKKESSDVYKEVQDCSASGGTWDVSAGGVFDSGGVCVK